MKKKASQRSQPKSKNSKTTIGFWNKIAKLYSVIPNNWTIRVKKIKKNAKGKN